MIKLSYIGHAGWCIEGNTMMCPLHNWKFNMDTDEYITSDKYCLSIEEV